MHSHVLPRYASSVAPADLSDASSDTEVRTRLADVSLALPVPEPLLVPPGSSGLPPSANPKGEEDAPRERGNPNCPSIFHKTPLLKRSAPRTFFTPKADELLRRPPVVNLRASPVQPDEDLTFKGGAEGFYVLMCAGDVTYTKSLQLMYGRPRTYPFDNAGGILRLGRFDPKTRTQNAWTYFAIRGPREKMVNLQWKADERASTAGRECIPAYAELKFADGTSLTYMVQSDHSVLFRHLDQEAIQDMLDVLYENEGQIIDPLYARIQAPL